MAQEPLEGHGCTAETSRCKQSKPLLLLLYGASHTR